MEKHVLSKSTFIRGVQCLKSLYLNKKRPFLRDRIPKERLIVFRRGHEVGELAQQLFPGGVNMRPGHHSAYRKAITNTREKISKGFPVLYEAAFQHDGVLIFLDILVHTGDGWHAFEVKSSGSISETYLMDAALQYYVIRGTGMELNGISIIHIDRGYVREGEIDPKALFNIVDVTEDAVSRQDHIMKQIIMEKETLALPHSPKIPVGPHCREPYDCDFIGHCWKNEPVKEKILPEKNFDPAKARNILGSARKNTAFLKLLGMKRAIPAYQGTSPYQEIPYAYGLSYKGEMHYRLFDQESNPQPEVSSELFDHLTRIDTVFCFGQADLCRKVIPEDTMIIDLLEILSPDSELHNTQDGDSLLKVIYDLTGLDYLDSLYTSDAVCAHHYLEDLESAKVKAEIKAYVTGWIEGIKALVSAVVRI